MDSIQQPCSSTNQCSICTQEAHGIHFGVYSCRACAAFFRRCIVLKRSYKCKIDGECNVDKNDRFVCRACRLEKCFAVGMTEENVQLNRDRMSSVVSKRPESPLQLPRLCDDEPLKECTQRPQLRKTPPTPDLIPIFTSKMVRQLEDIFEGRVSSLVADSNGLSGLAKMTGALKQMRADQKEEIQVLSVLDFTPTYSAWVHALLQLARWMQTCDQFAQLTTEIKMALFTKSWSVMMRLERLEMTIEAYGEELFTQRILYVFGPYAIHEHTKFVAYYCPEEDGEKVRRIFIPSFDSMIHLLCRPMFELNLSIEELTYALYQMMWHVEGSSVEEETIQIADKARDKMSSEIHAYYQKTNKSQRYADRIINIMSLIRDGERIQNDQNKVFELACLFGVLKAPSDDS